MNTNILFFGALADRFGRERALDLPREGVSIASLRAMLGLEPGPGVRAAVGQLVAGEEDIVRPGQEVAFFSPVSGG